MRWMRGIAAAGMLLSAGCLKFDTQLTLKESGAGTLELTYSLAEQTVTQIEAMYKLRRELEAAASTNAAAPEPDLQPPGLERFLFNPQKDEILAKLKQYEPLGVVVEKMEMKSLDIRRNVNIKVRFDSLTALAKTDFFQAFGFSVTKDAQGNYILERPASGKPAEVLPDMTDPEVTRVITPILNGFNATFTINTPARIVRTTAPITGPYSASWRFDFDRDPTALVTMRNQRFQIALDGREITLPEVRISARGADQPAGN